MTRMGGTVERAEKDQIERVINHSMKERFNLGTAERAVLLEYGDDPAIEPGQLMVRVFVPAPDEPTDYEQALATWEEVNRAGMDTLRRELSLRLPSARLLEFTFDDPDPATPRIELPDDGEHPVPGLWANVWVVVEHAGNGLMRNPGQLGHVRHDRRPARCR